MDRMDLVVVGQDTVDLPVLDLVILITVDLEDMINMNLAGSGSNGSGR